MTDQEIKARMQTVGQTLTELWRQHDNLLQQREDALAELEGVQRELEQADSELLSLQEAESLNRRNALRAGLTEATKRLDDALETA